MPKRSEKRDAAKAEYLARKGRGELVDLRELAEGLGVNYQTLRNWKSADEWEKAEPKKKRGGQPGNRNSAGHKNAAGSHKGAPAGNHNAEKDGAYSTIFFDTLSEAERELVMNEQPLCSYFKPLRQTTQVREVMRPANRAPDRTLYGWDTALEAT